MRPCLKRGARALFDFRLRFQISDFDFQSAIPGLFWGLAPFDLWYLSKQSGNTVAILYGVTLAAIAAIGSLLAFIPPLSGRSKCAIAIFKFIIALTHHRILFRCRSGTGRSAGTQFVRPFHQMPLSLIHI